MKTWKTLVSVAEPLCKLIIKSQMLILPLVNTSWFKLLRTISDDINLEIVRCTKPVIQGYLISVQLNKKPCKTSADEQSSTTSANTLFIERCLSLLYSHLHNVFFSECLFDDDRCNKLWKCTVLFNCAFGNYALFKRLQEKRSWV